MSQVTQLAGVETDEPEVRLARAVHLTFCTPIYGPNVTPWNAKSAPRFRHSHSTFVMIAMGVPKGVESMPTYTFLLSPLRVAYKFKYKHSTINQEAF